MTCGKSMKDSSIQVPQSPKQSQSPTDHFPGMVLTSWGCDLWNMQIDGV